MRCQGPGRGALPADPDSGPTRAASLGGRGRGGGTQGRRRVREGNLCTRRLGSHCPQTLPGPFAPRSEAAAPGRGLHGTWTGQGAPLKGVQHTEAWAPQRVTSHFCRPHPPPLHSGRPAGRSEVWVCHSRRTKMSQTAASSKWCLNTCIYSQECISVLAC